MKKISWKRLLAGAAVLVLMPLLTGCLEVEQHPPWKSGRYDGKRDQLAPQALYHGDRLAWNAIVSNRNQGQNEYNRTRD